VITFDGADDMLTVSTYRVGTTFTWAAWIRPSSIPGAGSYRAPLGVTSGGGGVYIAWLLTASNELQVWHNADSFGTVKATGLVAGTTYHVALSRAGDGATNGLKLSLDGVLVSQANSGTWTPPTADLSIGAQNDAGVGPLRYYAGDIEDVRFYSTALSAADIESLAKSRLKYGPVGAGLAAYWPLDAYGDGQAISDGSVIIDRGPNGYGAVATRGASGLTAGASTYLSYPPGVS
jgi:hypothetical protein